MMGAIDNMVKGAAGQAMQNMNLLFGLPVPRSTQDCKQVAGIPGNSKEKANKGNGSTGKGSITWQEP